jgi:hypothetical protein
LNRRDVENAEIFREERKNVGARQAAPLHDLARA